MDERVGQSQPSGAVEADLFFIHFFMAALFNQNESRPRGARRATRGGAASVPRVRIDALGARAAAMARARR